MKILLCTILYILSAFSLPRKSQQIVNIAVSDTVKSIKKTVFISAIQGFDTTRGLQDLATQKVVSCSQGTYKLVNNKYILRINTESFLKRFDNYYDVTIGPKNSKPIVELLVYDKLDASLVNICTDMINTDNNPRPGRYVAPISGELLIGFTKPIHSCDQFDVTALMKNLVFIDPVTKQVVKLDKEIIWKVFYDGTPG